MNNSTKKEEDNLLITVEILPSLRSDYKLTATRQVPEVNGMNCKKSG